MDRGRVVGGERGVGRGREAGGRRVAEGTVQKAYKVCILLADLQRLHQLEARDAERRQDRREAARQEMIAADIRRKRHLIENRFLYSTPNR